MKRILKSHLIQRKVRFFVHTLTKYYEDSFTRGNLTKFYSKCSTYVNAVTKK